MKLHTASEVISFARKLEDESAKLYQNLSQKYPEATSMFLAFAEENRKNVVQIERAYYGVITDAIEGCFSFDLNPDEYSLDTESGNIASLNEALEKAIKIEDLITKFYSDAAGQSESLMSDVPRAFKLVAKKRGIRIPKLKSLLGEKG